MNGIKFISLQEALNRLKPNSRVVTSMAAAEPQGFFSQLNSQLNHLTGLTIYCANPSREYDCFKRQDLAGKVEIVPMFLTSAIAKDQVRGHVHYLPQHLSKWSKNILRTGKIDVFWGSCSPVDQHGYVSLGTSATYESEIINNASMVILEVNRNIPVTYGATSIHTSMVSFFVENDVKLPTIPTTTFGKEDEQISNWVAELVRDESTIQLGIGSIPNAIGKALLSKKNLGVHTEMINDTIMDLYKAGVVTGRKKTIWPGKIVGAFAFGSQSLYDFINANPGVELHPASVVNDPYRIGRNHRMISINSAVEIDLTGQVCSESVGHREISGVGGAADTHVGAQMSNQGRGVVALHSLAADQKTSKIVFELKPGAKVSISRNDIDTVITEFGVAELSGRTVAERARALIAIAHPSVREELTLQARKEHYL